MANATHKPVMTKILESHGVLVGDPFADKEERFWPFYTNEGFAIPLVDRHENISPLDRFIGEMARLCPAPSLMPAITKIFTCMAQRVDASDMPEMHSQHFHVVLGDPGTGKTEIGHIIQEAMGWDLVTIPSGSGGGNMDELINETVFGSQSVPDIFRQIDNELRKHGKDSTLGRILGKHSLLQDCDDNEKSSVRLDMEKLLEVSDTKNLLDLARAALPTLPQSNVYTSRPGALLRALLKAKETQEPTVILLDEINRYKSAGALLQDFLRMMGTDQTDKCTIAGVDEHGNPKNYEFTRKDLKNVILLGTGNIANAMKESEVSELSESMKSRFGGVETIDIRFTPGCYSHRTCQQYLGFPLSTYRQGHKHVPMPDGEGAHFSRLRALGQTEAEAKGKPLTKGIERLMGKAGDACQGMEQFGEIYHELQEICGGRVKELSAELRTLGGSIPTFDPRQIQNLANAAYNPLPNPKYRVEGGYSERTLGTCMTMALLQWVNTRFPKNRGLDKTRAHIADKMVEYHIISPDEVEKYFGIKTPSTLPSIKAGTKLARDLINVGGRVTRDDELTAMQDLLFSIAKRKFGATSADIGFQKDAVERMLGEYDAEVAKLRETEPNLDPASIVPELAQGDKGSFTLHAARFTKRDSYADNDSNLPKMTSDQLLMTMIANKQNNLDQFFVERPTGKGLEKDIQDKIAFRLSESTGATDSFEQKRQENMYRTQNNIAFEDPIPADVSERIAAEVKARPAQWRKEMKMDLQGIGDGTDPAGIHATSLVLHSHTRDKESGYMLLRNQDPQGTQYLLVGADKLEPKTAEYLKSLGVEYINATDDAELLSTRMRALVKLGIERTLAYKTEEMNRIAREAAVKSGQEAPEHIELSDAQKQAICDEYVKKKWESVFSQDTKRGLAQLDKDALDEWLGKPISAEEMAKINALSGEEKIAALKAQGGGLREASQLQHATLPVADRFAATVGDYVTYALQHGEVNLELAQLPLEPVRAHVSRA